MSLGLFHKIWEQHMALLFEYKEWQRTSKKQKIKSNKVVPQQLPVTSGKCHNGATDPNIYNRGRVNENRQVSSLPTYPCAHILSNSNYLLKSHPLPVCSWCSCSRDYSDWLCGLLLLQSLLQESNKRVRPKNTCSPRDRPKGATARVAPAEMWVG